MTETYQKPKRHVQVENVIRMLVRLTPSKRQGMHDGETPYSINIGLFRSLLTPTIPV